MGKLLSWPLEDLATKLAGDPGLMVVYFSVMPQSGGETHLVTNGNCSDISIGKSS